jgi:sRNA-binding regulator protein Hfq
MQKKQSLVFKESINRIMPSRAKEREYYPSYLK